MKVVRIKEMITEKRKLLIVKRNSPYQHLRKCLENSMENMHTDVRVGRLTKNDEIVNCISDELKLEFNILS